MVDGELQSRHSPEDSTKILLDLAKKIKNKSISTRNMRGDVLGVLDPVNQEIITKNSNNALTPVDVTSNIVKANQPASKKKKKKRRTARKNGVNHPLFGGVLYLKSGPTSDLYRDISDLYGYYEINQSVLSDRFPSLIRMALRLLVETASGRDITGYLNTNFQNAKNMLSGDEKTSLSVSRVSEESLAQLLHVGAHNYTASSDLQQTLAISLIVGKMLSITHGRSG